MARVEVRIYTDEGAEDVFESIDEEATIGDGPRRSIEHCLTRSVKRAIKAHSLHLEIGYKQLVDSEETRTP